MLSLGLMMADPWVWVVTISTYIVFVLLVGVVFGVVMSWYLDRQHVKAEKRRVSEYLAKLRG